MFNINLLGNALEELAVNVRMVQEALADPEGKTALGNTAEALDEAAKLARSEEARCTKVETFVKASLEACIADRPQPMHNYLQEAVAAIDAE